MPQARALGLSFVAFFASAPGQSFLIAVFLDEMLAGTDVSRTAFSALYAGATVVSASAMLALGRAADRFGLVALWAIVSIGLALACGVASLAGGVLGVFVALALLRTFGQGSFPLLGTVVVNRAFHGRRGRAMALASFGLTAASIALPPAVVALIVAVGWEAAFRLLGLAVLALVLPLALLLRGTVGGAPFRAEGGAAAGDSFPLALRQSRRLPRIAVPTRSAAQLLLVLAAPPLVLTAIIFHAVSLLGARGLSLAEAGVALSLLGVANAVGTLAVGAVADRVSTRALLAVMSGLLGASALLLLASSALAAYAAFVLLGLGGGCYGVASGIVWARTYGVAQIGRLQGTSFAAQIAAAAAGPLPLAISLAAFASYTPALIVLAVLGGGSLLLALAWREPLQRA